MPDLTALLLRIGDRLLALDTGVVLELVRRPAITPLPETDPSVAGIVNRRGTTTPVLDLAPRLDGATPYGLDAVLLFLTGTLPDDQPLGLLVHDVIALEPFDDGQQNAPPSSATGDLLADAPIRAVLRRSSGELVPLLDPARLLSGAPLDGLRAALDAIQPAETPADA